MIGIAYAGRVADLHRINAVSASRKSNCMLSSARRLSIIIDERLGASLFWSFAAAECDCRDAHLDTGRVFCSQIRALRADDVSPTSYGWPKFSIDAGVECASTSWAYPRAAMMEEA